jgi:hypothetical protein
MLVRQIEPKSAVKHLLTVVTIAVQQKTYNYTSAIQFWRKKGEKRLYSITCRVFNRC